MSFSLSFPQLLTLYFPHFSHRLVVAERAAASACKCWQQLLLSSLLRIHYIWLLHQWCNSIGGHPSLGGGLGHPPLPPPVQRHVSAASSARQYHQGAAARRCDSMLSCLAQLRQPLPAAHTQHAVNASCSQRPPRACPGLCSAAQLVSSNSCEPSHCTGGAA